MSHPSLAPRNNQGVCLLCPQHTTSGIAPRASSVASTYRLGRRPRLLALVTPFGSRHTKTTLLSAGRTSGVRPGGAPFWPGGSPGWGPHTRARAPVTPRPHPADRPVCATIAPLLCLVLPQTKHILGGVPSFLWRAGCCRSAPPAAAGITGVFCPCALGRAERGDHRQPGPAGGQPPGPPRSVGRGGRQGRRPRRVACTATSIRTPGREGAGPGPVVKGGQSVAPLALPGPPPVHLGRAGALVSPAGGRPLPCCLLCSKITSTHRALTAVVFVGSSDGGHMPLLRSCGLESPGFFLLLRSIASHSHIRPSIDWCHRVHPC